MPGNCKPTSGSTSNACDQCFRTKQSCSKHPVQCERCAELGSSCTYSFGKFMGRPKRSLKSRRQFQSDSESTSQKQRETPIQIDTSIPSVEGRDEVQTPTLLPTPITSDGPVSSDWWQYSRIKNETVNYRFNTEDVENQSTKGDKSQPATTKKAMASAKTSACDQCYRFKVKCTREPDCCQRCSLNGNACTYSASADVERSRKRSAPPSIGSPKKKPVISSQVNPVPDANEFGATSTTTVSNSNRDESFFSKDLMALQPQPLHQNQGSSSTTESPHLHETFPVPQEHIHILDDCDLSFSDSSHCYTDILLSIPPLDSFFDSDNSPHDIEFDMDQNEVLEQLHSIEAPTKPSNIDTILVNTPLHSCSCLQSAILSLSNLHTVVGNNSFSSFDSIFAAARNGLFICESLSLAQCSCQPSSTSTLLMLCVAILQQVYNAYDLLANPPSELSAGGVERTDKKMALSIKIGDMEFTDIGHSPSIMKAILKIEKAKAERICVELEKMARNSSQCGNFPGPGRDETMVQDGLVRLIEVFRGRFISEVI